MELLTFEQEIELSKKIMKGQQAKALLESGNVEETKIEYLEEEILNGLMARDALFNANLRLVTRIVSDYLYRGVAFDDLYQVGLLGLATACNKYDYQKGVRFSTYAAKWILEGIYKTLANEGRAIRLPNQVYQEVMRFKKNVYLLGLDLDHEPTIAEISKGLNMEEGKVLELMEYSMGILSLDSKLKEDSEKTFADTVEDSSLNPLEKKFKKDLAKTLNEAIINVLSEREGIAIKGYFGINGEEKSFEAIGALLGVCRERSRQIVMSSLAKIKNSEYGEKLKAFICQ